MSEPVYLENPVNIARSEAEEYFLADQLDFITPEYEKGSIVRLQLLAESHNLIGSEYTLHAKTALVMPALASSREKQSIGVFYDLPVEARFSSYTAVHVPLKMGQITWKLLCLEFEDAQLLPDRDILPEGKLLRVPILEVGEIQRLV